MKVNRVKKALKAGEPVVGTIIHEARNPEIAHLLAAAGMDFILVDTEHSSPDPRDDSKPYPRGQGGGPGPAGKGDRQRILPHLTHS